MITKLKKTAETLAQKLGRLPTPPELAKAMNMSAERLKELDSRIIKTSSLEAPMGEEGEEQIKDLIEDENIESPEQGISRTLDKERIVSLLDHITERERNILDMRFGLNKQKPHTLAEVARKLKVSRERIRQIEEVALKKLRKLVTVQGENL